jgi:O-antigen/teichoic acid export membrane protein
MDSLQYCVEAEMPPESVQMLLALALGFAIAGLCSSAYQLATDRLPSFGLLSAGPSAATVAAVPLLMLSAPFLIMRNTLVGRRQEGRRFEFVFLATVIAGFWSLMSGLVVVMSLEACGLLA